MASLRVRLFGKLCIQRNEQVLDGFGAGKAQELFCWLLLHRGRPHSRESLAGQFWGESADSQQKKYLRHALWQLQTALDDQDEPRGDHVFLIEPEWIELRSDADLWLDVAHFEQCHARAEGIRGQDLDVQSAQALRESVEIYRGDLLEGWYQDWCLYERERLQNAYLSMLDRLMVYSEAHQEYDAGLDYGDRILRIDRAHERTHRRLMRLRFLAGDRTAALRQYECCVATLERELGVPPAARTVALYQQIRADRLESTISALHGTATESAGTPLLPEIVGRLKQFRARLADIEHELARDIEIVEMAMEIAMKGRG